MDACSWLFDRTQMYDPHTTYMKKYDKDGKERHWCYLLWLVPFHGLGLLSNCIKGYWLARCEDISKMKLTPQHVGYLSARQFTYLQSKDNAFLGSLCSLVTQCYQKKISLDCIFANLNENQFEEMIENSVYKPGLREQYFESQLERFFTDVPNLQSGITDPQSEKRTKFCDSLSIQSAVRLLEKILATPHHQHSSLADTLCIKLCNCPANQRDYLFDMFERAQAATGRIALPSQHVKGMAERLDYTMLFELIVMRPDSEISTQLLSEVFDHFQKVQRLKKNTQADHKTYFNLSKENFEKIASRINTEQLFYLLSLNSQSVLSGFISVYLYEQRQEEVRHWIDRNTDLTTEQQINDFVRIYSRKETSGERNEDFFKLNGVLNEMAHKRIQAIGRK